MRAQMATEVREVQFELNTFCPHAYPDNDGRHDAKLPFVSWVEWPPLTRAEVIGRFRGKRLCSTSKRFYVMTTDSQYAMAQHFAIKPEHTKALIWCEHMGRVIE